MNRIEVALGISVVLFSVLAILVIFLNIATVIIEPLGQRFTFTTNAKGSLLFIALIVVAGIAAAIRYRATRLGSVLGWAILFWSPFAFWWVSLTLNSSFLKRSLADELIWISFPLMVFIFLGIGLVVDSSRTVVHGREQRTSRSNTRNDANHFRSLLLVAIISMAMLTIQMQVVKADSITFTESDTHHKPRIRWFLDLGYQSDPFAGAYLSTTPCEETLHWNPNNTSVQWQVEATRVTVSFPDTPDPSVIGANNWLAVGIFVQGKDDTWHYQDYGYYTVLVLDSGGNLWLDVGGYRTNEFDGYLASMFDKTWQIQGLSRSTPINLTAAWTTEGFIVWNVTINGVPYQPPNNSFNMRLYEPTAIENFFVGWENIFPWNDPYHVCYYFQFGITSPNHITQGGWNALVEYPQWCQNGEWHTVQQAQTVQGSFAYLDSAFMWGGDHANAAAKCHNNDPGMERYKAKFYYSSPPLLVHNDYLWRHEPETPPAPSGPASGYTNVQMCYTAHTTDPEDTTIQYKFDWGDGAYTVSSYWPSGTTLGVWHAWANTGTYQIRVCAFDYHGKQSQWSPPLAVTISKPHGSPGGCPFVFTWNGTGYLLDNNLLPESETSNGTDATDYYMLQQELAQTPDGTYSLLLSEFESEQSFFDQVQLLTVDHSSNVNVAVSPNGEVLTYTNPYPAVSAIDNNHRNVKSELSSIDGNCYEGYNGSYITLNFGDLDVSDGAKFVLRADWAKRSIHVQVQDSEGKWVTVATVIPRIYWATEIIDLSAFLPDARGNLKLRLCFTANHKLDFVGLDTSPQATIHMQQGQLLLANHSIEGDVTTKLLNNDQAYAELVPGQSIEMVFALLLQTLEKRNYIIIAEGHYYIINP